MSKTILVLIPVCWAILLHGCASMKGLFGVQSSEKDVRKISNPFESHSPQSEKNFVYRSKKGDRSIEIEIPNQKELSNFTIPVSPQFNEPAPQSPEDNQEVSPGSRAPSSIDREITATFPQGSMEEEGKRNEIERTLGLIPSETNSQDGNKSYLASLDYLKRLYKNGRFEKALLETDDLIRQYQTDPKLHQMRGTLLDRLGKRELALRSWNQALRYDPNNDSLKKFIDRKSKAGTAQP